MAPTPGPPAADVPPLAFGFPLTLITAALPYANGSLHLGHLLEYCMVDTWVRARRALGENIAFVCANDAHGTPIEINAKKLGLSAEALVAQMHAEHTRDFARFDVAFDHFTTTHSPTNAALVQIFYRALQAGNHLDERAIDQHYCARCCRFLPDRFIKGACPKCHAPRQYGDVCEACGATYTPEDLVDPLCVICGNAPTIRRSTHLFFQLSQPRHTQFLKSFIDSGALQDDVANYVRHWIAAGLKDWCISRDGPYFGFAVPDRPGKYFYVWLDAPIGYVAAATEWGQQHGLTTAQLWKNPQVRIEHVIGKDILYFHTLFWPALLHAADFCLPDQVSVHGMLTVNGEKMSKSRGTFITARTFADALDPESLRYYLATKYTSQNQDVDLSFSDFLGRVNGELVNKHANLFRRCSQFLWSKFDGMLGDLPFATAQAQQTDCTDAQKSHDLIALAREVVRLGRRIEGLYRSRDIGQLVRDLAAMADIGNEFMQARAPWSQVKTSAHDAQVTCTFAANICYALAMYLAPIVPKFAHEGLLLLGATRPAGGVAMNAGALFAERNRQIGTPRRLFERIEAKSLERIVDDSANAAITSPDAQSSNPTTPSPSSTPRGATAVDDIPDAIDKTTGIDMTAFAAVDMRVGRILEAEAVPKSRKLLRLMVDVGEATPRQILSGIAEAYKPADLVQRQVVVVINLNPARMMGYTSFGMVLAAGTPPNLHLCTLAAELPPGSKVR